MKSTRRRTPPHPERQLSRYEYCPGAGAYPYEADVEMPTIQYGVSLPYGYGYGKVTKYEYGYPVSFPKNRDLSVPPITTAQARN